MADTSNSDESDDDWDTVDGTVTSARIQPVGLPSAVKKDGAVSVHGTQLRDGNTGGKALVSERETTTTSLIDEPDGNDAPTGMGDEADFYSNNEEGAESFEGCRCRGSGSCVSDILKNTRNEQQDAVRTGTVNKTGIELIQKHTMVSTRTIHTHSPKDLFSIINRNRGALSVEWMIRQAPMTFLHAAVINKRMDIIPVLVDCGLFLEIFDCKVRDQHSEFTGYTAMEIAELHKNDKMISLLKEQKRFAESFGWMHRCARDGNMTAVKWLMEKHPSLLHKAMPPMNDRSSTSPVQLHTGTEPIYWAVTSGSVPLVNFMLSQGANVHSTSSEGETLLTRATSLGQIDMVRTLVEKWKMTTNDPGYEQKMPVQRAVANKDVGMVRLLMQLDTQIPDSLLNDVAKAGHVQMFHLLKDSFHNLDLQDELGKFPLYYALHSDNLQMAEELIKSGAKLTLKDRQQRNLLHMCVSRPNHEETFQFLLRHLKQKNNKKKPILHDLINQRDRYIGGERCFLVRGRDGGTAAYHYVEVNRFHTSLFRKMTRAGGALDVIKYGSVILSGWGATPEPDVVESIEKRYDITKVTDTTAEDLTPLNLAILKENYDMALTLIELGADVNIADSFGLTPLHMACMQGNLKVVTCLEKAKAKMQAVDNEGHSPLDAAVVNQHNPIVNFLRGSAVINLKDLEKFRKLIAEYSKKISNAKLQEARGDGKDIKRQLMEELRMIKVDINSLCTTLGYGPVMQETSYQNGNIMTETSPASQR